MKIAHMSEDRAEICNFSAELSPTALDVAEPVLNF